MVLFSDASKFSISFGNEGRRIWRKGEKAHSQSCLKSSVKFPQTVMIWGSMSSAGVGPLCFLKTNVTAPIYQEFLEHFMLPSAEQLFKDADFIFQQDLAHAHTAKSTKSQIKSLLLSHHHSTSALVSEILTSVLQTVQKKQKHNNLHMDSTYLQTVQKTMCKIHIHILSTHSVL